MLRRLCTIASVGDEEPYTIVLLRSVDGHVVTADESMAAKVKWAQKAGYRILTRNVPEHFAPYNAVIRISETGTEDRLRDYLAEVVDAP